MFGKQKAAMIVAEFLGTGFLVFLVLTVQRSQIGLPYFVAIMAGITVVAMVFAFGKVGGAYLNPALVLGLWTARKLATMTAAVYLAAEFLAGWAAYGVYHYLVHQTVTNLATSFSWRTFTAEAIGAFIFTTIWAAAVYQNWNRTTTAAVVGLALVVGMVAASAAGYGLINPALALGVRSWNWGSYVAAPAVGAVIGVNLFANLFATDAEKKATKSMATSATDWALAGGGMSMSMSSTKTAKTTKKTSKRK